MKRPPRKVRPRWVCIVSHKEAQRLGQVSIAYRCRNNSHAHLTQARVEEMVSRGELTWVGKHYKIAQYADHLTWAKMMSGGYAVMEMVKGLRR